MWFLFFSSYLAIFGYLFNGNAVPFLQLEIEIENMISISIDRTTEMQDSLSVREDGGDSVSNFSIISGPPILFEGNNTGPIPRSKRVDLQIKTDPELRTPAGNCSNLSISLDISRKTNVLPDQVSVAGISCRIEIVSSKDTNILECPGFFVFHTMYFFSINRDRVIIL